MITGTRRRVKVEKIPQLLVDGGADEPAKPDELPNTSGDDTCSRKIGSKALLPCTAPSADSLASFQPKKLKPSEDTVLVIGPAMTKERDLAGLCGESQGPVYKKESAGTENKESSVQISSRVIPEAAAVSQMNLVPGSERQANTQKVSSSLVSKTDSAALLAGQSSVGAGLGGQSSSFVAQSERPQGRIRIKPKPIQVRADDAGPDQNCKPQ